MKDLFLDSYKGYAPKEAGALSYYAKALAHTGLLGKHGRKLGMRGLKKLSFNEKRDLLKALKNDVFNSTSMPGSHQNNKLLKHLRTAVNDYYTPFTAAKIAPPKNRYDYYGRLQDMTLMNDLRLPWTPNGQGANQYVTMYNAPFLQGVKQHKVTPPASFSIN